MLGVAQDTRSRDGRPLQAQAFDGPAEKAGGCARLRTGGVELPPGPPDQRSPGTRRSQSRRGKGKAEGRHPADKPVQVGPVWEVLFDSGRIPSGEGAVQGDSEGSFAAMATAMDITRHALAEWEFPSPNHPQSPNIPAISTRSALVEQWLIADRFGRFFDIRR
jgi:hypothetical protein